MTFYISRCGYPLILILLLMYGAPDVQAQLKPPVFEHFDNDGTIMSNAGYVSFNWDQVTKPVSDVPYTFEIQQAPTPSFANAETIYRGHNTALFISGLKNGEYYFRIRSIEEETGETSTWSEPLMLKVRHHPMERAQLLFALGAILFLAVFGTILVGHRKAQRGQA